MMRAKSFPGIIKKELVHRGEGAGRDPENHIDPVEGLRQESIYFLYTLQALIAIGLPALAILLGINLWNRRWVEGSINVAMAIVLCGGWVRLRREVGQEVLLRFGRGFFRALLILLFAYLAYSVGVSGLLSRIQWAYICPVLAFTCLGLKEGCYWTLSALALTFILLENLQTQSVPPSFMRDFEVRSLMALVILGAISFALKYGINLAQARLVRNQAQLERSGRESREAYEELKKETEERERVQRVLARSEEAVEALESANRAKSAFLGNMSHELRTPLNHIMGFTELILGKNLGGLTDTQEEYLNDVLQSSRHLLSLINDVLDISKVEAGKMNLDAGEVDLRSLLENSLDIVREKAAKAGISLTANVSSAPEAIRADERKIKQVIFNLLSNAVKFTPDGGAVTITARSLSVVQGRLMNRDGAIASLLKDDPQRPWMDGAYVEISVADSGIGLAPEDLERIFDPFEQVDNSSSRPYQGTGLGLTLTRRLVELHGGRIWAESEGVGRGSVFRFVLPVEN
jgi:signal transduction histidine kinase